MLSSKSIWLVSFAASGGAQSAADRQWHTMGLHIMADCVIAQAVHRRVVLAWLHDCNRGKHGTQGAAQGESVA